jgi:hypothetical protein
MVNHTKIFLTIHTTLETTATEKITTTSREQKQEKSDIR